ncbi:MAG: SIS domain-containing protein [Bacillota bacterium]|nr:SIS domain-containing protein [Bacillota bacterium]
MFLPFSQEQIKSFCAEHTVKEILQQPKLWVETFKIINENKDQIKLFFESLTNKHGRVRFVFTGAGTSAFVGETITPFLRKNNKNLSWDLESIATTDLVSSPKYFLNKEIPTVLVSFARSGNSPESVAAVEVAEKIVQDFYQITITCNEHGQLAKKAQGDENTLLLLMPPASHDEGFAMTSSFSCMMLAALIAFQYESLNELELLVDGLASGTENFLSSLSAHLETITEFDFERIIYLGSGLLGGIARESALKVLELTSGKTVAMYETPLGFRHGPKSIMNDKSLIVFFMSHDEYTRKYELDLLKELNQANLESKIAVLDFKDEDTVKEYSDWQICIPSSGIEWEEVYLGFVYVTFAQTLAVKKSIHLGISVDNPSVDGLVNRVVQGVTIYPL